MEVSRDLKLTKPLPMARRGRNWTAVEVQKALADLAGEFVASGAAEKVVPGAAEIVRCWHETLEMLGRRDLAALARRCDWALKYVLLDRQRGRRGLTWKSPEIKVLDLLFSSVDAQEGLFWQMAAAGMVEALPAPERVERFLTEPPDDTRAYLRAHVLRRFGDHVVDMDWARIRFRLETDRYWWSETALPMPDPTAFGREQSEPILARCETLTELIAGLGIDAREAHSTPRYGISSMGRTDAWGQRGDGYEARPYRYRGSSHW
jgi:proteasome accessory factor A